jgi:hypothetical protein
VTDPIIGTVGDAAEEGRDHDPRMPSRGPRIGQHQDDVLGELEASGRLDKAATARLRQLARQSKG